MRGRKPEIVAFGAPRVGGDGLEHTRRGREVAASGVGRGQFGPFEQRCIGQKGTQSGGREMRPEIAFGHRDLHEVVEHPVHDRHRADRSEERLIERRIGTVQLGVETTTLGDVEHGSPVECIDVETALDVADQEMSGEPDPLDAPTPSTGDRDEQDRQRDGDPPPRADHDIETRVGRVVVLTRVAHISELVEQMGQDRVERR